MRRASKSWWRTTGRAVERTFRARLRDRRSAAIVRARKTERAEETAAASGGVQSGAAAQEDDRSWHATRTPGPGRARIFSTVLADLGHPRDLGTSTLV